MVAVSEDVENFIIGYWDTDTRLALPSETAREQMRRDRIEEDVRQFLLDVILRGAVSPEAWAKLVNAQTYTCEDVQRDATEFWMWLYDGAPIPGRGGPPARD